MGERDLRLERFAAGEVDALIAAAREDALVRARKLLTDAMTEALVTQAAAALAPSPRTGEGGRGLYVFGVVRQGTTELPVVAEGGLAAVVREVPLSEYGEAALRENLNDIEWLEDAARRHESVLDGLLRATTVIPLRLCTIYRSAEAVRDMLAAERAELVEALDRLEGRTEWGVKAFRAAAVAEAEVGSVSGGAYMELRRQEAAGRRRASERADAEVSEAFARLAELAAEALANPLQARELSGRSEEMVLNGVFLVDDAHADAFRAAVHALDAASELSFELTGPWPPYNFVKRSVEAAR